MDTSNPTQLPSNSFPFLLFAWSVYDACGGWGDFKGAFASLSDAQGSQEEWKLKYGFSEVFHDWRMESQIIDIRTGDEL